MPRRYIIAGTINVTCAIVAVTTALIHYDWQTALIIFCCLFFIGADRV